MAEVVDDVVVVERRCGLYIVFGTSLGWANGTGLSVILTTIIEGLNLDRGRNSTNGRRWWLLLLSRLTWLEPWLFSVTRRIRMSSSTTRYWLLKAEPDTRVVKGKDVKVGSNLCKEAPASFVLRTCLKFIHSFYSLAWTTLNTSEHRHGRVSGTMKHETWWRKWKKETRFASNIGANPIEFSKPFYARHCFTTQTVKHLVRSLSPLLVAYPWLTDPPFSTRHCCVCAGADTLIFCQ